MPKQKAKHGFTLIELLLVMAILGIVASIMAYGMIGQQRKARDAKRKSDLQQVKKALQQAKNDCQAAAYYPHEQGSVGGATARYSIMMNYLTNANTKYLPSSLPGPSTGQYRYMLINNTIADIYGDICPDTSGTKTKEGINNFVLRVKLENTKDPDLKTSFSECSTKNVNWAETNSAPTGGPTTDVSPADGVDDGFYYYVCND